MPSITHLSPAFDLVERLVSRAERNLARRDVVLCRECGEPTENQNPISALCNRCRDVVVAELETWGYSARLRRHAPETDDAE